MKKNRTEIQKKLNKFKSWFFEKMSKIDRFLPQLSEKKEITQTNRIRNKLFLLTHDKSEKKDKLVCFKIKTKSQVLKNLCKSLRTSPIQRKILTLARGLLNGNHSYLLE